MHPAQMFMAQRLRTTESNFSAAAARVLRIDDLAELMRASHVSVPPELRGVVRSLSGHRTLRAAITRRAQELVAKDLADFKGMKAKEGQSKEDFLAELNREYGKLRHETWAPLRGHEPTVLSNAFRQAEQLIAQHMRAMR